MRGVLGLPTFGESYGFSGTLIHTAGRWPEKCVLETAKTSFWGWVNGPQFFGSAGRFLLGPFVAVHEQPWT